MNVFTAKYDGVCAAACGFRIHPGDAVRFEGDVLVHDECTPEPDPYSLGPREVVCPDCWLVKPCRCDE